MNRMLLAGAALGAMACASHPPPTDQIANSLAAARGAEEAGALAVPEAALHLKLADQQITRAKQLMAQGDNLEAEGLAARAGQDAELAIALARENQARLRLEALAQAGTAGGEQTQPSVPTAPPQQPVSPLIQPGPGQTATP